MTLGEFVAFNAYLGMLTWPMIALGWVINIVERGSASAGRMNQIFDTQPEIFDESVRIRCDRECSQENPLHRRGGAERQRSRSAGVGTPVHHNPPQGLTALAPPRRGFRLRFRVRSISATFPLPTMGKRFSRTSTFEFRWEPPMRSLERRDREEHACQPAGACSRRDGWRDPH